MNLIWQDNQINSGLSIKSSGSMKGDWLKQRNYLRELFGNNRVIVSANLVHGSKVISVDGLLDDQIIPDCDALITSDRDKILSLTVADCLPIYFYDRKQAVTALAHAGWRGLLAGIVTEAIFSFKNNYQSKLEDIEVQIGPHIKACHFEVKADVASQFPLELIIRRGDKTYIDLAKMVVKQLSESGFLTNNISVSDNCTHCLPDKYFSYRRDRPKELETMLAYIGFK